MYACLFQPPVDDRSACGLASAVSGPARGGARLRQGYGGSAEARDERASEGWRAPRGLNNVVTIAADFSPRYECHRDDLVSIDISGLGRLFGSARDIGEELRRDAAARGLRVHVAIASTRTAALMLAMERPVLTVD